MGLADLLALVAYYTSNAQECVTTRRLRIARARCERSASGGEPSVLVSDLEVHKAVITRLMNFSLRESS